MGAFTGPKKATPMDFTIVIDAINRMAAKINPGAKLPETVDESNLGTVLPMFVDLLCGPLSDQDDEAVQNDNFANALANAPALAMSARVKGGTRRPVKVPEGMTAAELREAYRLMGIKPRTK